MTSDTTRITRETLLHEAERLFAARGYDAVGVQEIVAAAGVTKPTLYHHYGSKRGLLDALLRAQYEPLLDAMQTAAIYTGDLPLTLRKIVAVQFEHAQTHPAFFRMKLTMSLAPPESEPAQAILRYNERQFALLENLFMQAAHDHGNMRGRHRRYAVTLLGVTHNYIVLWLNGHLKLTDEVLYHATHQFMHGIFS